MITHAIELENLDIDAVELAVSPQVLPKLQQMISDCNTNPDEIRDMIRLEPALSAMVLKTANSAYFNPGYHIDSIDDGIMHLGFSDVYQICTMLAFTDVLAKSLPTYGIGAGEFWARSVACALAMERLARKYGEDPAIAYTAGLLHGIGMIFIENEIGSIPNVGLKNQLPEDIAIAKEELQVFGVDHAKVGASVMHRWGFSDDIVVPVRCQFDPSEAGKHERMACLMSFAKRMIGTVINENGEGTSVPGPDPLLIALLHLSKEEYIRVAEKLRINFNKAKGLVGVIPEGDGKSGQATKEVVAKNPRLAKDLGYGSRQIREN
ncbi:HDOD domain-containing protein [Puniceicoccaceae bacterium K14]|nr:HDOD domain-containing protein [Puniceicoccaceae bacterium K14]